MNVPSALKFAIESKNGCTAAAISVKDLSAPRSPLGRIDPSELILVWKKNCLGIFARDHQDCRPGNFEILNHFLYLKCVCVVIVSCTVYPVPVPRHHVSVVQVVVCD